MFEIITSNMESHASESLINSDLISMMIFIKLYDLVKLKTSTFKVIVDAIGALFRLYES